MKNKSGYVYLMRCQDFYKIGFSKNVERRQKQLDTRPFPLDIISKVYSEIAFDVEQEIHQKLEDFRVEGEWYSFDEFIDEQEFYEMVKATESVILVRRGLTLWLE